MLASIDRGTGPAALLLHGQPGSGASWDPLTDRLAPEFRVLAPDRIGYGASAGEARGLSANAELLAAFLRERGASPATVVAHSWSGGVAVYLAARHRSLVQGLVLVGAACTADSVNALDRWLTVPVVGDVLTAVGLVGISSVLPRVRRLAAHLPSRYRDLTAASLPEEGFLERGRGSLARQRRTFTVEQRALNDELPAVVALLSTLDLPVAVVSGQWDLVVPARAAVGLARAIPGAELTLLPRAGHFVARDAPEELAEVVRWTQRQSADRLV
ncbi:MAG: alpha/beta hydrolase [Acidimicrobiales bacterium]|jgi:pimeloyl-ACP methyl ester carboxylesterase